MQGLPPRSRSTSDLRIGHNCCSGDLSLGFKNLFPNFGPPQGDAIDRSDSTPHFSGDPLQANALGALNVAILARAVNFGGLFGWTAGPQ
jgi:hypothetical protein